MDAPITHVVAGSGPPLLLLNGGLMSIRAWDPVATRLETTFTVVRCDLRGQLLSPGTPPATLDGHVDDLVRLLDHLSLPQVSVAGTSFGGLVGLLLAARHPGRVKALAAITTTDHISPEVWQAGAAVQEACRAAIAGGDGGAVIDLLTPATFSPAYRQRFGQELAVRRQIIAGLPRQWFAALDGLFGSLEGLDLRPLLPQVTCPVLVLAGGLDLTFPVFHSQALAAGLPNAHLHIVPHGSHGLVVEEPELVAASLTTFLLDAERRTGQP